jgi:transposase InsO family protein
MCSQNRVPAGPGARRGRCPRRGGLPVSERLDLRLLRLGHTASVRAGGRGCRADGDDPPHPCRLPGNLWGAPRVLAELRLGLGVHVGRKRVARLMRSAGLIGVSHRRKRRGWKPDTATHEDLVKRRFRADAPGRLWFCDMTQHPG